MEEKKLSNILKWTQTESMLFIIEGADETYITPQSAGSFEYKIQTSPVTNMDFMFYYCNGLTELDLSLLDTSKTTHMGSMFYKCSGLTELDLYPLDTSKVTHMACMFGACSGLTELDLSLFDTSKVAYMAYMFSGCTKLETLTLGSGFDMSSAISYSGMFTRCTSLKTINAIGINAITKTKLMTELENAELTGQVTLITE